MESTLLSAASQPTLKCVLSDAGAPLRPSESKKEEPAGDAMGLAQDSPVVDAQATTTLSSNSEAVLLGIQNM